MLIPSVIEKNPNGVFNYDIYSRLLEDRIIFLPPQPINAEIANSVISQMLYLESKDSKKDIKRRYSGSRNQALSSRLVERNNQRNMQRNNDKAKNFVL